MPTATMVRVLEPLPSPAHALDDPERLAGARRLDCRGYDRCLARAAAGGWRGFHCRACPAYVPQTPAERYRDHLGLLQLVAEAELAAPDAPPPQPATAARHPGGFLLDDDDTRPVPLAR